MVLWAKQPSYSVLYNNLSDEDGGAIVTQLTQMNIPYRFAENGGALMVPEANVHELRLRLAQQGLPKGGSVGFELLDKEKFGISQFSEQVNYQRAAGPSWPAGGNRAALRDPRLGRKQLHLWSGVVLRRRHRHAVTPCSPHNWPPCAASFFVFRLCVSDKDASDEKR